MLRDGALRHFLQASAGTSVAGVRPATRSAAGRTQLTITGFGFDAVAKVLFEGPQAAGIEPSPDFTVDSDRKITAKCLPELPVGRRGTHALR